MTLKVNKQAGILVAAAVASAFAASTANASHFRGAALVPTVDANGLLTVDAKSFWRLQAGQTAGNFPHSGVGSINVSNGGGFNVNVSDTSISQDLSDVRRAEINEEFQLQLPGAGLYTISWLSGSWVGGVPNAGGNYGTTSAIFWDGSSAAAPILFDLENIQQQVIGGADYSDNLDAVGAGLTYDDTHLSIGMRSQARGFDIDATGQINIAGADTGLYTDNGSNLGADEAFSGKINAADGSSVEFVWLFDTVDSQSANLAPSITDVVINALVGDTISETLVVTDPNAGDVLTTSFISFLGSGGAVAGSTFDPNTLQFNWDSTGFAAGTYVATFGTSDGSLTDQGTVTINLSNRQTNPSVSEPSTLAIAGLGMLGLAAMRRRRKAK